MYPLASLDPKLFRLTLKYLSGEPLHDRKTHEQLCKALLGDEYTSIHAFKDRPAKYLGKRHRVLFHDQATNVALALVARDPKVYAAAVLHDLLDFSDTKLRYPKKR